MKKFSLGGKALSVIGFVATGLGFLLSGVSDWVGEKKMEEAVREEVQKQLTGGKEDEE